ncbi:energy transducer TonB [Parahaliea maris]|uniref:Energy transducer TonB n=1 Tax=Parahaliea maris TaxID=2716870 RepID=A0A5C9A6L0_9GAMM|nr:energy transducer TonB [Parahaliea maris]TXS96603.1 energy transducer TonB [Parahaliea maris]
MNARTRQFFQRTFHCTLYSPFYTPCSTPLRAILRRVALLALAMSTLLGSLAVSAQSGFIPPERISGRSPSLNSNYTEEAWLVYTYKIDAGGNVVDAVIQSSNGIPEVDSHMLAQIEAMKFRPATRNGNPVEVPAGPVVYTWILDIPRAMRPEFSATLEQAWEKFRAQDYDGAFDLAAHLKEMPGRNAFEDVKFQVLAASIASRWDDPAIEMQHLKRVMEFQNLADRNRFENPYVEPQHYALMLARVHELQLANNQLADAQVTFNQIQIRGSDDEVIERVKSAQLAAQQRFQAMPDVATRGELTPLYRGGSGTWETRLSRDTFELQKVRGDINWIYLACLGNERRLAYPSSRPWEVPVGWKECKVEISGRAGTRFELHQLDSSRLQ